MVTRLSYSNDSLTMTICNSGETENLINPLAAGGTHMSTLAVPKGHI